MMSDPLVAFLTAQIDERERIARSIAEGEAERWELTEQSTSTYYGRIAKVDAGGIISWETGERLPEAMAQHIALHDPTAVLADIASKRLILSMHAPSASGDECIPCVELDADEYPIPWPCPTMRALATAFRHVDGYRAEWAYDA